MTSDQRGFFKILGWIALVLVLLAPFYKFIGAGVLAGTFMAAESAVKAGEARSRDEYRRKHEGDVLTAADRAKSAAALKASNDSVALQQERERAAYAAKMDVWKREQHELDASRASARAASATGR